MKKILVIGERIIDYHIYGTATRLGPDAPYPVFIKHHTEENRGGAANVVANLTGLAPEYRVEFICNYQPIIKTRYVDQKSNYILLRVDEHDFVPPISVDSGLNDLSLSDSVAKYEAIIFSSYNKGFLSTNSIFAIAQNAGKYKIPTFLDCRFVLGPWSRDIFITKINEKEYQDNLKERNNPAEYTEHLIVTLGEKGAKYNDKIYPTNKVEVRDLSGAGDSFMAGLVTKYLETKDIEESIKYANKVASFAVSKKGVIAVKREDIV